MNVRVESALLDWAAQRSGRPYEELLKLSPQLPLWRSSEKQPTLRQLEDFARATRTPIGFFFLAAPPIETVPIPDFRTLSDRGILGPSADLLDTIYECQQRQTWYEQFARANGHAPLPFVGSATLSDDVVEVATRMRETIGFQVDARKRNWEEALRQFVEAVEAVGIMVMVNGIVGSNTRRKLDPEEFRGMALSNPLAPLVFVNGADSRSAQMFTLAHELAHLWVDQSALSDADVSRDESQSVERWCNQVGAELLVPLTSVPTHVTGVFDSMRELSKRFKVSGLVALRRLYDGGAITREQFWGAFTTERKRLRDLSEEQEPGGQYYPAQANRIGRVLGRALVADALEGRTSFTQAFQLMGVKKLETFEELGRRFGVAV